MEIVNEHCIDNADKETAVDQCQSNRTPIGAGVFHDNPHLARVLAQHLHKLIKFCSCVIDLERRSEDNSARLSDSYHAPPLGHIDSYSCDLLHE